MRWGRLVGLLALLVAGRAAAQGSEEPLFRLRQPRSGDRLLTTNCQERHESVLRLGFTDEGVMGALTQAPGPGLVPLVRFAYGRPVKHFYTTDRHEGEARRYAFEGVLGYLSPSQAANTVPLVRLYDQRTGGHFYTSSEREASGSEGSRYKFESVMGYLADRRDDPCPVR